MIKLTRTTFQESKLEELKKKKKICIAAEGVNSRKCNEQLEREGHIFYRKKSNSAFKLTIFSLTILIQIKQEDNSKRTHTPNHRNIEDGRDL